MTTAEAGRGERDILINLSPPEFWALNMLAMSSSSQNSRKNPQIREAHLNKQ